MKLKNRIKRSTKQYIIVAAICLVVIGGAAVTTAVIITNQVKREYQALLSEAYRDMEQNQRSVYVAVSEIPAGEEVSADKVRKVKVYSSQPQDSYIGEEELGRQSLIDIAPETQILSSMLTDSFVESEFREMEYGVVTINSNIASNDTVDIRISYPNGESYVVLSKKMVRGIAPESVNCFLWMREEEIQRMSAAIVDAGLYEGAALITSKYIEPAIQEASQVTYIPSLAVLNLLENDPNIVERCSQELNKNARKALENRLALSMTTDVSQINWDVYPNLGSTIEATPTPALTEGQEQQSGEEQQSEKGRQSEQGQPSEKGQQSEQEQQSELGKQSEQEQSVGQVLSMEKQSANQKQFAQRKQPASDSEYFYYTQEEKAKESDIEYGE